MDSPRGRLHDEGRRGRAPGISRQSSSTSTRASAAWRETACPSGVRYAPLIEQTRAAIEEHHERSLGDQLFRNLLFRILPYHRRLRALAPLGIVNLLQRTPRFLWLPAIGTWCPARVTARPTWPSEPPRRARNAFALARDGVRARVFGEVSEATVRAGRGRLRSRAEKPGRCGALGCTAAGMRTRAFAALIAVRTRERRSGRGERGGLRVVDEAADDSAGDPAWAEQARVFSGVRDVTGSASGLRPGRPGHLRSAWYHDACHLAHARIRREPRALESIPGLTVVPIADPDLL